MARRVLVLILLVGLVCQSLGSAIAGWSCEGRYCSASLIECCCASPSAQQDSQCEVSVEDGKPCVGKCGCKLTLKRVGTITGAFSKQKIDAPPVAALDLPVVLPPTFDLPVFPLLAYAPVRPNPPPPRIDAPPLASAALRAPPFSFG